MLDLFGFFFHLSKANCFQSLLLVSFVFLKKPCDVLLFGISLLLGAVLSSFFLSAICRRLEILLLVLFFSKIGDIFSSWKLSGCPN